MSAVLVSLYDEFAPEYERTRVPRFRPFLKNLLRLYDTRPGSHVLDAGCGTGLAATMVAPRVGHNGRVLGVDASEAMLEIARHKAQGFGFDQCEFVQGETEHLQVPNESFDLVICSFAFWGLPSALFSEFFRVLKPNGAFLMQNWDREAGRIQAIYAETLRSFSSSLPDERVAQARAAFAQQQSDWSGVRTPGDYERVLRDVGFSSISAHLLARTTHFRDLDELINFHDAGVVSRAEIAALSPSTRVDFHVALRNALGPFVNERGVHEEWRAVQVIARK